MRNSAKYLLATAGIYLLTAGHPAADSIPVQILDPDLKVTTVALERSHRPADRDRLSRHQ